MASAGAESYYLHAAGTDRRERLRADLDLDAVKGHGTPEVIDARDEISRLRTP